MALYENKKLKYVYNDETKEVNLYTDERDIAGSEKFCVVDTSGQTVYAQISDDPSIFPLSNIKCQINNQTKHVAMNGLWRDVIIHGSLSRDIDNPIGPLNPFKLYNVSETVRSIAINSSGHIYVGGVFNLLNGASCPSRVAKSIDGGNTWTACGSGSTNHHVYSIAINSSGHIYVGGEFTTFNGVPCPSRVAKSIDGGNTWTACGSGSTDNFVYSIAINSSGHIYVGGNFTTFNGVPCPSRVAKSIDGGNTWTAIGSGTTSSFILSIAINSSGHIYVGGNFTTFNGVSCPSRVAKSIDGGNTWTAIGSGSSNSEISLIVIDSNNIYVGGFFTTFDGIPCPSRVAKSIDGGNTWTACGSGSTNGNVRSIAINSSGHIYVGGNFTTFNGISCPSRIAKSIDGGNTWTSINSPNMVINGQIFSIVNYKDSFYFGGAFTNGYYGKFIDPSPIVSQAWIKEYTDVSFEGSCKYGENEVYICGNFTTFDGIPCPSRVAKSIDGGNTWTACGSGSTNGNVRSIAINSSGHIYVGGEFTTFNGVSCPSRIAKSIDGGNTWTACGSGSTNGNVRSIAINSSGHIYVGGEFTTFNGASCPSRIAKSIDGGNTWTACGSGSTNHHVYSIAINSSGHIYVGGEFTTFNGVPCPSRVAKSIDGGNTWTACGSGSTDYTVFSIAINSSGHIYVGGAFTIFNGISCSSRLAKSIDGGDTWDRCINLVSASSVTDIKISKSGKIYTSRVSSPFLAVLDESINKWIVGIALGGPYSSCRSFEILRIDQGFY